MELKSGFFNLEDSDLRLSLEQNAEIIVKEVLSVNESLMFPWHEKELVNGRNWLMTPVYLDGVEFGGITNLLPNTVKLLSKLGCIIAGISILQSSTEIKPHSDDIYDDVLLSKKTIRMQLGIKIPSRCSISVQDSVGIFEERHWEKGKILAFDSSRIHKAINSSDQDRVVLICDFGNQHISDVEISKMRNYYLALYGVK